MALMVVLCGMVAACASTMPAYDYAKEPDPRRAEYVIGASDVLRITVRNNPDLTGDVVVRPDGTLTMPLVGDVKAAGRTPTQVQNEIGQRLSVYIKSEVIVVTVAVSKINSYRWTVAGNVTTPGSYSTDRYASVVEAIALAGGFNRFGDPEKLVLIRTWGGNERRIPINYQAIVDGKHAEQNLVILPGDVLYVP